MSERELTWRPIAPHVSVTYYGGAQYLVSTRKAPMILVRVWQGVGTPVPDVRKRYYRYGDRTGEGWFGQWRTDSNPPGFHAEQRVRRSRHPRLRHLARPWQLLVPPPPDPERTRVLLQQLRERVNRDASQDAS